MRKMRPILSWILVTALLVTNVDYVRATSTPSAGKTKETLAENVSAGDVVTEDIPANDVSNGNVNNENEQDEDVSTSGVSENDISEEDASFIDVSENIMVDVSMNEADSEVTADSTVLYSGSEYGVTWQITSDGTLLISGEKETDTYYTIDPDWRDYKEYITKVVITAKNIKSTEHWFNDCNKITDIDMSGFDTSTISNMKYMFKGCSNLTSLNVSNFNTSNVYTMDNMFYGCKNLSSLDVSNFDTSNVKDMCCMFGGCNKLEKLNLSNFDTSNVSDMQGMFSGCSNLTLLNISSFDTSNVLYMDGMFQGCSSLSSIDVSHFNTEKLQDIVSMFNGCSSLLSLDVSRFDTSNIDDFSRIFSDCSSLATLNVSNFNTSKAFYMIGTFHGCSSLTSLNISNFNTQNVIEMDYMFDGCSNLTSLDVSNFITSNVISMRGLFKDCKSLTSLNISSFDTSYISNLASMFEGCNKLTSINMPNFNNGKVYNISSMFKNCNNLKTIDLSKINNNSIIYMSNLFENCSSLTSLDFSNLVTSNVTDMSYMFSGCSNLDNINISNFDTSNVTDMSYMFSKCNNLININISNFNTSNVTDMSYMFSECNSLINIDISNFNTSNVKNMRNIFYNCLSLVSLDISNFDMSNVSSTINMLSGCPNLNKIKVMKNLQKSLLLPYSPMYDEYENTYYTHFPTDLTESIWLYKTKPENIVPEQNITTSYSSFITVYDKETKMPIVGATVIIDNKTYTTDKDGCFLFTGNSKSYSGVTFTKEKYLPEEIELEIDSILTTIYMTPNPCYDIDLPSFRAEMDFEESANLLGQKVKWLDIDSFGWKLDFPLLDENQSFPVKYELDEKAKTMKVVFGINQSDKIFEQEYYHMKGMFSHIEKKGNKTTLHDYAKKFAAMGDSKIGVNLDSHIMGYYELNPRTGEILESGAYIILSGSGSLKWYPAFGGSLYYVKGTLTLTGEGKLVLDFSDDDIEFKAEITLSQGATIANGLGGNDMHLEIGVEGTFSEIIELPWKNAEESLTVKFNSKGYMEGKIFEFEEFVDINTKEKTFWPKGESSGGGGGGSAGGGGGGSKSISIPSPTTFDTSQMTLSSRDYGIFTTTPLKSTYTLENVYPDAHAQMVELENGTLLAVWLMDLGTKSDVNRTTLVYSTNQGNGWSEAQAVCETGRADFYPSLAVSENKAILVYTNMNSVLSKDITVADYAKNVNLYTAVYENGTFSAPELLTESDNQIMEFNARIAMNGDKKAIVWVENSKNDPFLMDGKNAIYLSTCENGNWNKQLVAENLSMIPSLNLTWLKDKIYITYTLDQDNSLNTTNDMELYLWSNGVTTRLTSDSKADSNVQFLGDKLYWTSDSEIMQMTIGDITSTTSTGISGVNDYQILQNATNRAILFIGADGFCNELYLSEEVNGVFTTPVPVTDYGNHISDYAAVYRDNGEVTTLLFEREVLNTDDAIYGQTNLHMSESLAAYNLILNEAWYNMDDITEDNKLPVNLSLYNASSEAVKSVTVTLAAGNETLHTETVTCDLAANGVADIVVNYPVTLAQMGQKITVKVVPVDFADSKLADNTYEMTLGLADVALKDFAINYQEGASVMTGTLTNEGYQTAANVAFTVLEGGADGAAIHTVSCGDLAAGAEYDITYTIPTDKLAFSDAFDVKYFHVLCETDNDEDAYGNNSENIAAFPVKVTGLTLDATELSMTAGSIQKLNVTVAPENALDKSVYYISDCHEVAVVLEDGTIIACEEGTATISAITSDGAFVQSCVVTVTAPVGGTSDGEDGSTDGEDDVTTYEMNTRWASLEIGNTQQLSLTDGEGNEVSGITWSSSNTEAATVDANGLVTAVAVGTTYIICTNEDNSYYNVCVIHVTSKELQALVFEASSTELTEGKTVQMLPAFYPIDTTTDKTLQWSTSDAAVATVSTDGVVTGVAAGTATITATAVNGITAQFKVTVRALPRYTVTFDTGLGDESVEITDILGGNTVTLPTQPTREGYNFKGWFTEQNGKGTEFTATTIVNSDVYLYAFWEYIPVTPEDKPEEDKPEENVPDGLWVTDIEPQTYTGKAIKPAVKVYDGHTLLKEKVDYTISYKNNTKANDASVAKTAPTITVTGKGNYTGKETVTFKILPKNLTAEDISVAELVKPSNNKVQQPIPVITYKGKKLANKKDFTVTYPSTGTDAYKAVGTYVVKVTGTGNFTGELEIPFEITNDVLMSKTKIAAIAKQTYTGSPIEPEVTVTYKKATLVKDKDYTVTYKNNVEVGKATVVVTGMGDYAGSRSATFQIVGESIAKASVDGITDKTYNGQEQTQSVTVTLNGAKLAEGTDYEVTYEKNINVGTAKLTITGKGRYSGTIKKTFKINAYDLKADSNKLMAGVPKNLTVTYTKGGSTPSVELTFDDSELVAKKDYTLSYKNNKKPAGSGDAKAPLLTIKGKGNFTGSIEVPFTITERNLKDTENPLQIRVPDMAYNAKAGKFMSKPVLVDSNGKKLTAGTDYDKNIVYTKADGTVLTKADTPQVGDIIKATIIGKGYYTGTVEAEYKITQASFTKAKISVNAQSYTGSAVTLDADDLTVKMGGTDLKYGEDYEIVEDSYTNNVKKGTATVTIKGKGKYGGEKTVKFKITSKRFVWFWNLFN